MVGSKLSLTAVWNTGVESQVCCLSCCFDFLKFMQLTYCLSSLLQFQICLWSWDTLFKYWAITWKYNNDIYLVVSNRKGLFIKSLPIGRWMKGQDPLESTRWWWSKACRWVVETDMQWYFNNSIHWLGSRNTGGKIFGDVGIMNFWFPLLLRDGTSSSK